MTTSAEMIRLMKRRFVVEEHLRTCGVYDCQRGVSVATGMTKALARKVARMLNDEHNFKETDK